uniref:NADH dehydrogenase subunit 2 n=1 Tax=Diploptera punctata TaxID=6984 RepID=UPI002797E196|nr:NADH dehydrogenase subunit 2 [Diploptera punctata]WGO57210.1 NADH dehydrogenase subunit 2 [Diploptera punctata]
MSNNSAKILFMTTLISGLFITISSNSWLGAWMGLEINLLSFIPLMTNYNNIFTTEASLKYFLIQALASSILLFVVISKSITESLFSFYNSMISSMIMSTPLLMKSGAAPLHWWFPSVMEGLSWNNCFILMTIQKIAPLMLISYTINFNGFIILIILTSIIVGAVGGYNQISIRKILTYSSINHLGWMIMAMLLGENLWLIYFSIYSLLTLAIILIMNSLQISFINQTFLINNEKKTVKILLFLSLLSLGGLPPFLGFLPKWMVIQSMLFNWSPLISSVMVIMSLVTLYYYLRISYSSFIILSSDSSWVLTTNKKKLDSIIILISAFSTLGLILSTLVISIY